MVWESWEEGGVDNHIQYRRSTCWKRCIVIIGDVNIFSYVGVGGGRWSGGEV